MAGARSRKSIEQQLSPSLDSGLQSRHQRGAYDGRRRGYEEGYFRGKAQALVSLLTEPVPQYKLRMIYVSSGKGFPYSPLDEAVISTLKAMSIQVTVSGPRDEVTAAASQLRPDLVLVLDGMDFTAAQLSELRALGVRTALWITDDPYYTDTMTPVAPYYDYVFTLEANVIPYYESIGCSRVSHLPFAAYPEHFTPRATYSSTKYDLCFVGTAYWNRVSFFEPIIEQLMEYNMYMSGLWWNRLKDYKRYQSTIKLDLWMGPKETAEVYNNSKIAINMHRSHNDSTVNRNSQRIIATSPNPRTFEINGCGTLQLTDARSDLAKFYIPGKEVVTYETPAELLEKVAYYLAHEEERKEIALRGLVRTLKEHSYAKRIDQLISIVFNTKVE